MFRKDRRRAWILEGDMGGLKGRLINQWFYIFSIVLLFSYTSTLQKKEKLGNTQFIIGTVKY